MEMWQRPWFIVMSFASRYVICTYTPQISPYPIAVATESDSAKLICIHNGAGPVLLLKWTRNTFVQGSLTTNCEPFGQLDTSMYSYNCTSEKVFTWTILHVTEEQHGDMWSCEILSDGNFSSSNATIIFVEVPVQSVNFSSPSSSVIKVNETQLTEFKCITSEERPRSVILWYFDGNTTPLSGASVTPLNNDTRTSTTGTLRHRFAKDDDGKKVFCTANNIPDGAARNSEMKVLHVQYSQDGPPTIRSYSNGSTYNIIESTDQILHCSVAGGNPRPELTWNCNNGIVAIEPAGESSVHKSVTWTATRYEVQDCICTSSHPVSGSLSSRLSVKVLYPPNTPSFDINGVSMMNVAVINGRNISVRCTSQSKPAPTFRWTSTSLPQPAISQQLILINTDLSKTGTYTCTANNEMTATNGLMRNGSQSAHINIDVLYPPSSPELKYLGSIISGTLRVILGDDIVVNCVSEGKPTPTCRWNGRSSATLQLVNIESSSRGQYTCKATNTMVPSVGVPEAKTSSQQIDIDVLYGPSSPKFIYNYGTGSEDITSETTVKVIEGKQSCAITCSDSAGNPSPSYTWSGLKTSQNGSLQLSHISKQDSGAYTCHAQNTLTRTVGTSKTEYFNRSLEIDVLYPPVIEEMANVTIPEGGTLDVSCLVVSNPGVTYHWTRTNQTQVVSNNATLYMSDIHRNDSDTYICKVENTMEPTGEQSKTVAVSKHLIVTVLYKATIARFEVYGYQGQSTVIVDEHDSVVFVCEVDSNPSSTIYMLNDGEQIQEITNVRQSTYDVEKAECTDAGIFTCQAQNTINSNATSEDIHLFVTCSPRRRGKSTPEDVITKLYDSALLSLYVLAYPSPKNYTWRKNTPEKWVELKNSTKFFISSDTMWYNMTVNNIVEEDVRDYTLEVDNGIGEPYLQHFVLRAHDIPLPVNDLRYIMSTTTTAVISWTPGFNSGLLQTFYIEYKPVADESWLFETCTENDFNRKRNITITSLKPGTSYEARLFSGNELGNSSWTGTISFETKKKTVEKPEDSSQISAIIGATLCSLVAVVLFVALVIFYRRRKRPRKFETSLLNIKVLRGKKKRETNATQNLSELIDFKPKLQINSAFIEEEPFRAEIEHSDLLNENKIQVHKLWDYLNLAFINNGEKLQQDYQKLPSGLVYDCTEASRPENGKKNRYRDMIAYDHSRVILERNNEKESNYINANYIDGYKRPKKFIASQGPTQAMIVDFWDMILQQKTSVIVMLTNLIENGAKKCMKYWPEEEESEVFGDITLTASKITMFPDYVIRELDVTKTGEMPKRVVQIHFTAWPDKAVPDTAWHLVSFWRKAATMSGTSTGPILVHCSAGVGRTGTYIALDNLYTQAKTEGYIEPFEIVNRMREHRVNMVQTKVLSQV